MELGTKFFLPDNSARLPAKSVWNADFVRKAECRLVDFLSIFHRDCSYQSRLTVLPKHRDFE